MKQICGDCLHYNACAAWNIGSLANTDAGNCINFEHIHLYDSVEVVRCKDCRDCMEFTPEYKEKSGHYGTCRRLLIPMLDDNDARIKADDYCSYGERKEDEDGQLQDQD